MKNTQNIFDNEIFFQGYQKIRDNPVNYNSLLEQPSIMGMLPDLTGEIILDMGCGAGSACLKYIEQGASQVVGTDISEKMLELAKIQSKHEKIQYYHMDMCDIKTLNQRFDVIVSSLAVHYVADFKKLLSAVFESLNNGGYFVFSQEHPLTTAPSMGPEFTKDENGQVLHYNLTDYGRSGIRSTQWMVEGVINYHRTFSEIINGLIDTGFTIERMLEPLPEDTAICLNPNMIKEFHKPSFLIIRARKNGGTF